MHVEFIAFRCEQLLQNCVDLPALADHCQGHADQLIAHDKLAHSHALSGSHLQSLDGQNRLSIFEMLGLHGSQWNIDCQRFPPGEDLSDTDSILASKSCYPWAVKIFEDSTRGYIWSGCQEVIRAT